MTIVVVGTLHPLHLSLAMLIIVFNELLMLISLGVRSSKQVEILFFLLFLPYP